MTKFSMSIFNECINSEAAVKYWFNGKKNLVLVNRPEKIFQKSLRDFILREVDCTSADLEPMFSDGSRCDIRIFTEEFDLYFIEIKWIGFSAKKMPGKAIHNAEEPSELKSSYGIGGARQTFNLYYRKQ